MIERTKPNIIQTLNPKINRYVKVNRVLAKITVKKTEGPYINIHIV